MKSHNELAHENLMDGLDQTVIKEIEREIVGHWLEVALDVLGRDLPTDTTDVTMEYIKELQHALDFRGIHIEAVPIDKPEMVYQFRVITVKRTVSFSHHVDDSMEHQGGVH